MAAETLRKRLDTVVVERGFAQTQPKAQAMILAGEIFVNGTLVEKAGTPVSTDALIEVKSRHAKYASRGGLKLEGALKDFGIDPTGLICLDIGASNGGFTDCLLQHGAARVYAADVNVAQLDWKLQKDPRVIPIERNARELKPKDITEAVDLVVADVSFISACNILQPAASCAKNGASLLILVKPQFELRREDVAPGGVVYDERLHETAVTRVRRAAEAAGLVFVQSGRSCITGAEGNQEYFLQVRKPSLK
ncbi:MAG TPA: TlyA family RNA methyltransferase [Candidatus Acidoferrum sp.]|nr:TlyA family RNA methyltransferase [Candidatus Acidoferrum sp.]